MSKGLKWYWSRLTCMSPAEIVYRSKKTLYMQLQKNGYLQAKYVPTWHCNNQLTSFITPPSSISKAAYLQAADEVISGHIPVFGLEDANLGNPPDWNKDPLTKTNAPMVFGKTLNYRDSELVGDIKYLWEPNRHLQLVTIAQAYYLTEDLHYLNQLRIQLDSWFEQCPYLQGPNWTSSLELGIRLINWSLIWQLIGGVQSKIFDGTEGEAFKKRWMNSIYQHQHFIAGHFSGYSSANNHLIGEAAGLFVATVIWPCWEKSADWQRVARKILEKETQLQNAADGVNLEQAISYQQFVLDFLLFAGLAARATSENFTVAYWEKLERMMVYLASIMDVNGNLPMIGDADDGYVVKLSQQKNLCPYRSLLATGALLFDRGDFKIKAGEIDDKTRWLFGDSVDTRFAGITQTKVKLPICRQFPDGGYYVLGNDFETENEIRLIVDAGPLGYQSIAAHGHADALAFTLSYAGLEFLIDPGTYAYHTQQKWRDYFRGTSAHNTVRVDGMDQSESGGNFMWLHKAQAECLQWDTGLEQDTFKGRHDGYCRLKDAVTHTREIILHKKDKRIEVIDTLDCQGMHEIEIFWHFSEGCQVSQTQAGVEVIHANRKLMLNMLDSSDRMAIHQADENIPSGWISRRFDVKEPTQTLVFTKKINHTCVLKTEITCQ